MKRLIAAVITVGVVTLGTAGVASAQQTGGSTNPTTQQAPGSSSTKAKHPVRALGVLRIVATTLGLKPRAVVTGLCGGQTLAQLASANGKSASDLTTALVKAGDTRIAKAEKAKRITAAQAAQRESKLTSKASQLVNSYQPPAMRCQKLQSGAAATTPTSAT